MIFSQDIWPEIRQTNGTKTHQIDLTSGGIHRFLEESSHAGKSILNSLFILLIIFA